MRIGASAHRRVVAAVGILAALGTDLRLLAGTVEGYGWPLVVVVVEETRRSLLGKHSRLFVLRSAFLDDRKPNMTTWESIVAKRSVAVVSALVLIFMLCGLGAAIYCKGFSSSETAGWMQAIGSFVAIGAAILVAYLQSVTQDQQAAKRDQDEVEGMLDCLSCEMQMIRRNTAILLDEHIIGSTQGVEIVYPVPPEPFKIYDRFIPKLGMIKDEALRNQIVETYTYAASFVATIRQNNAMFEAWQKAVIVFRKTNSDVDKREVDLAYASLSFYGDGVRNIYSETVGRMEAMIDTLVRLHDSR